MNAKHEIKKRIIKDDDSLNFIVNVVLKSYEHYGEYKKKLSDFENELNKQTKLVEGGTVPDSSKEQTKTKKKEKNDVLIEETAENQKETAEAS